MNTSKTKVERLVAETLGMGPEESLAFWRTLNASMAYKVDGKYLSEPYDEVQAIPADAKAVIQEWAFGPTDDLQGKNFGGMVRILDEWSKAYPGAFKLLAAYMACKAGTRATGAETPAETPAAARPAVNGQETSVPADDPLNAAGDSPWPRRASDTLQQAALRLLTVDNDDQYQKIYDAPSVPFLYDKTIDAIKVQVKSWAGSTGQNFALYVNGKLYELFSDQELLRRCIDGFVVRG